MIPALIVLAILVLIGLMPVGVWVEYNNGALTVKVPIWLAKITAYPRKKKEKKKSDKPKKKREIPVEISVASVLEFLELLAKFVAQTGRRLRLRELKLQVVCGGSNAATAALDYGKACAIICAVEPLLDRVFATKRREIQADVDFEAKSQTIYALADIRLTVASALYLLAYLAKHGFVFYKKRKKAA